MIFCDLELLQKHGDVLIAALCEQLATKSVLLEAREKELHGVREELLLARAALDEVIEERGAMK